jgi:hypothetical protein
VAGVSLFAGTPSTNVKTELLSEEPTPAAIDPKISADVPQGVTAEIVAVIEAAAAAFVGKKIRILSVKVIGEAEDHSSAWASQGRDMIQSSHNQVQRGH